MARSITSAFTFDADRTVVSMLAISLGWQPLVEDTDAELDGDNYPLVENPVTLEAFMAQAIPVFIQEQVVNAGRNRVRADFDSIHDGVTHKIKAGEFDALILSGDLDSIKAKVLESVSGGSE